MKHILVYSDEGVSLESLGQLERSLNSEISPQQSLKRVNRHDLLKSDWEDNCALIVFPGGRDLPYHQALKGESNRRIRNFITSGGSYLGICAGAYYACARIEFDRGGPLQVIGDRELGLYDGCARGPSLGPYCYLDNSGAAAVEITTANQQVFFAYFNGGCSFDAAPTTNVQVLARYTGNFLSLSDLSWQSQSTQGPAIIKCAVGKGLAILCGTHIEYQASHLDPVDRFQMYLRNTLNLSQPAKGNYFKYLLGEFGLGLQK